MLAAGHQLLTLSMWCPSHAWPISLDSRGGISGRTETPILPLPPSSLVGLSDWSRTIYARGRDEDYVILTRGALLFRQGWSYFGLLLCCCSPAEVLLLQRFAQLPSLNPVLLLGAAPCIRPGCCASHPTLYSASHSTNRRPPAGPHPRAAGGAGSRGDHAGLAIHLLQRRPQGAHVGQCFANVPRCYRPALLPLPLWTLL